MMAVIGYECPECGSIAECDVNDVGERVCANCGPVVTTRVGEEVA
ncbi:hypothetical protein VB779_09495 [Haloarculaceae archaeon H-GB11]|nr:hypothetical protein [Haloarculaceae archaeon H-GB11]